MLKVTVGLILCHLCGILLKHHDQLQLESSGLT